jgi:hypothetical protein
MHSSTEPARVPHVASLPRCERMTDALTTHVPVAFLEYAQCDRRAAACTITQGLAAVKPSQALHLFAKLPPSRHSYGEPLSKLYGPTGMLGHPPGSARLPS